MPPNRRSHADSPPNWESVLRQIEEKDITDDPRIRKLTQLGIASRNQSERRQIGKLLQVKIAQRQAYPFEQYDKSLDFNQIQLGASPAGARVVLDTDDLMKHLLTVGQSGAGKTTLFYNLMDQLDVPFWSFDLKQDYRHLAQKQEVLVLPWTELKFNPLKPPPGVPPRRWAQVFSEVFGHATALLSGSKNHLLKQLITLYQLYELFNKVSEPYPSTHELEMLVGDEKINYVRKTSNYRDTLLNRIEAMNLTAGTVFDCSQGYPVEELLQRNVVFEFDGLNRDVQNFLMEILVAYIYEYRLAQNHRAQGLNHVFFLDEGKRVFSVYKERQDASGIPEIDELTAKMREFGEGLVVADQEASKLTDSIKANTYTKILLPIGDQKQFNAVADSMNLSDRQADFAQKLQTGEAIVQTGNHDPVPVRLENYDLEKSVSDEKLRSLQAEELHSLSHEPRDTTLRFETYMAPGREDELEESNIIDDPTEVTVSENADRLLEDIIENPFRSLLERYDEFSNRYQGNKAKNEIVDAGLVVERTVKNGDNRKLLELTENGRDYVENSLNLDTEQQGRGGIIHQYWQHRIKEAFEAAGWDGVETETFDADVYVHFGFMELMIEVAMTSSDREVDHVEERLDGGIDAVWVVCKNEQVRDRLKQKLEKKDLLDDRVAFRLFQDFAQIEKY